MTEREHKAEAWDAVSQAFNEGRGGPLESVDYGPFCPLEDELSLLGSVVGKTVLDVGCGGGQNAVILAKQGAVVTAVDSSARQLEHAERLADEAGMSVELVQSDVVTLYGLGDATFDHILCTNVLPYIEDMTQALNSMWRLLRSNGQLTLSMDHPIRACFIDAETSELSNYPERDYQERTTRKWRFAGTSTSLTSYDRPVSDIVNALLSVGFALARMLEPPAPNAMLDEHFPVDGPLASLRSIPHTLLIVAHKPES